MLNDFFFEQIIPTITFLLEWPGNISKCILDASKFQSSIKKVYELIKLNKRNFWATKWNNSKHFSLQTKRINLQHLFELIPTGLARNRSESEFGCAFHESAAPCRRHTRPSRAISRRIREFPCATADPCSLLESWEITNFELFPTWFRTYTKCDARCTGDRSARRTQQMLRRCSGDSWWPSPSCCPTRSWCPASVGTIGSRKCSCPAAEPTVASSWTPAGTASGATAKRCPAPGWAARNPVGSKSTNTISVIEYHWEALTGSLQRTFLLWSTISKPPV